MTNLVRTVLNADKFLFTSPLTISWDYFSSQICACFQMGNKANVTRYFMPPHQMFFLVLSVRLSVINFNFRFNFLIVGDMYFKFGMTTQLMTPFKMTPYFHLFLFKSKQFRQFVVGRCVVFMNRNGDVILLIATMLHVIASCMHNNFI